MTLSLYRTITMGEMTTLSLYRTITYKEDVSLHSESSGNPLTKQQKLMIKKVRMNIRTSKRTSTIIATGIFSISLARI